MAIDTSGLLGSAQLAGVKVNPRGYAWRLARNQSGNLAADIVLGSQPPSQRTETPPFRLAFLAVTERLPHHLRHSLGGHRYWHSSRGRGRADHQQYRRSRRVLRHRRTRRLVRLPDLDAKGPSALAPPLRPPSPRPPLRHASRDQRDSADKTEPALAAEPTERMEATEATEPIERIDPAEPMDKIEPVEPMDKIDPLEPILSSEPAEPADRSELFVFPMPRFSHSGQ